MSRLLCSLAIAFASVAGAAGAVSITIFQESDPVVGTVDYAAYFDAPDFEMVNYQEGGLTITPIASELGTLAGKQSGSYTSGCEFTCTDPWLSRMGEGIYYSTDDGAVITGTSDQTFGGLQLTLGDGRGVLIDGSYLMWVVYEVYNDGALLDSGTFTAASGDTILFSSLLGFDELWIGSDQNYGATSMLELFNDGGTGATALDNIFARDITTPPPSAIPLPASFPLLLAGLVGLGWVARRRKQA
ncbi:VPLPA-CTERM sorting domain-containing protein [Marimonas sp. MJW-29]|uniref:VPLPA-CTERM sorting domain-containing protein n=1 Tax=Sulfitobacter sediminis TaxID=3234186 RepID=A0ABV3RS44_9RHOB